jgi:hypothetical protein
MTAIKHLIQCALLLTIPLQNVFAQRTGHASLRVTAQVQGSISIEFSAGSDRQMMVTSDSGPASFTVPTFGGSFSPNSNPIAGGAPSFLISSPFAIRVIKANLSSSSYSLKADLATPDVVHSWIIDGVDVSSGREHLITANEVYGTSNPHTLVVSGPAPVAQERLVNAIRFLVVAN